MKKPLSLFKTKCVDIDNKLKFEGQIQKICREVSQQVAVLNRLKKMLPFELRLDIYISSFHCTASLLFAPNKVHPNLVPRCHSVPGYRNVTVRDLGTRLSPSFLEYAQQSNLFMCRPFI